MPARAAACFTIACVFCRSALADVWYSILSRLPSFVRIPSLARFQPAASRIWFAFSTLNSHRMFGERNRVGPFR